MKDSTQKTLAQLATIIIGIPAVKSLIHSAVCSGKVAVASLIAPYLTTAGAMLGPIGLAAAGISAIILAGYIIDHWDELCA